MADSPFLASANTNTTTQGSIWAVLVQPSFPDLVFEAAALLTKTTSAQQASAGQGGAKVVYQPSEFALQIKETAQALVGKSPAVERDEAGEDAENEGNNEHDDLKEHDTEETREQKQKIVLEVWTKAQPGCFAKSDDQLEATANLLITLLLSFFAPTHEKFTSMVQQLLEAVATADGKTTSYGRFTALFTLFNALPAPTANSENETPFQLVVLSKLTDMGSTHPEDLNLLLPSLLRVPSYLTQWGLVSSPNGVKLLAKVIRVLQQGGKHTDAFNLAIAYLSSPALAKTDASGELEGVVEQAINLALTLPDCYDWDVLDNIRPIAHYVQSTTIGKQRYQTLFGLLKSPTTKYQQIEDELKSNTHLAPLISDQMRSRIERKARLLTLTELCAGRVGGEVTYAEVQTTLGLETPTEEDDGMEVEEWVINAVKAKLISARLHQPSQVIYVTKSTSRSFGLNHWQMLQSKLKTWGGSIDHLIGIVGQSLSSMKVSGSTEANTSGSSGNMLTASA
ncbi:hypothetical protein CROQUDRAFT_361222 [Cronartium quercuum f. sp. fusiforme G11]|uniref:Eukaryotic translation initiation factor 3 subunit M n=1 Tax=Cronartium quercuum f. sp. fusiforme G11 TaxID=708437 RepID=A0A9P6NNY3_9BASI|nr:hypothetical protein CROQUDRAFT_361222 [Cronartium quercuum f. sp. fusiforme G11]